MAKKTPVKLVPVPADLHKKVKETIKVSPEFVTITEFVRRAIKDLLDALEERNN